MRARSSRAVLRGEIPDRLVQFAVLEAPPETIAAHLHARQHQFMNPNLLGSQLATLEHPGDDAWPIFVGGTPEQSLAELKAKLAEAGAL